VKPLSDLEALILAGGLGTRIRPVLGEKPKALAPVDGAPFIDWLLCTLRCEGLSRAILCLGHGASEVVEHVGRHPIEGLEIAVSVEPRPLGTAGALRHALDRIRGRTVLALNGDTFLDLDWERFVSDHVRRGAALTLACTHADDRRTMGAVECDEDGRIVSVSEKSPSAGPGWASAGTYLIERHVIEAIPGGAVLSLERDILPGLVGRGLHAHRGVRRVHDIGTPEGLATAQAGWRRPSSTD